MKSLLYVFSIFLLLSACQSNQSSKPMDPESAGSHKVLVQEVIQVGSYTYLRVTENNNEYWLATPPVEAKPGDTYYYEGGFEMTNFMSNELNRVFESILFLEDISTAPVEAKTGGDLVSPGATAINEGKKEVKVTRADGAVSIEDLFMKKEMYSGKTVKVTGEVVKFSPEIMGTNWIHIQDGTEFEGKFDLAVTSDAVVSEGDVITFEGPVILDKDLGYGYFFEVLIEDAKLIK